MVGALALTGLAGGVFVAQLGWAERAHPPTVLEWVIQLAVLLAALALIVRHVTSEG